MQTYKYTALEASGGKKVKAEVQAQDEKTAVKLLTDRGMTPLKITLEDHSGFSLRHKISVKQKIIFSRQLSTLINAGLPLVQSLRSVLKQIKNKKLASVIENVIADVEAGSSLSDAFSRHPKVFNDVFVSLVAAGEASGTLDKSLERLANQQEKDHDIISKVRGAMMYPLIVLLVLFGIVIFMLTTVLPQVQTLYEGLPGTQLPLFTRVLLAASGLMTNYWWVLLIIIAAASFGGFKWVGTIAGKDFVDKAKLNAWPIGPLFRKLYMARFARTAATLVGSGVPMIKMLTTTAEAIGNVHVAKSILKATESVKGGKSLSDSLAGDPNFLDLVPDMIRIGEQSGQLQSMLEKLSDYYEKEVDNQIKTISTVIEPLMMIVVGVVALVIVIAVLLPIYSLAGNSSFTGSG